MKALRTVATELIGLFIEDKLFALAIAGWLLVAGAMATYAIGSPELRGLALFLGLAIVLIAGVSRGAIKR